MKKIILASASPRRKELLTKIGLKFEIMPSNIDENIEGQKFSYRLIEKLAFDKAFDIAEKLTENAIIIGADTVVILGSEILGKPKDKADATKILTKLSGKQHQVVTGIAVIDSETGKKLVKSVTTKVTFRKMTREEIENYIATGEPMDKAGAYGAQGVGTVFIEKIEGCYNNVVGISTYVLSRMLKEFEIKVL